MQENVNEIVNKIKETELHTSPFKYIYIENFLPNDMYEAVLTDYPTSDTFREMGHDIQNNIRYQLSIKDIYTEPKYEYYRSLIENVFNQEFYNAVREKFKEGPETVVGRRFMDEKGVQLDFQPGINSPVTRECTVRNPHVDSPEELFAGLLYLRAPEDDSTGGELELYSVKGKPHFCRKQKIKDNDRVYLKKNEIVNTDSLVKELTIPYKANNFVMFVNNKQAIHGVSPRGVTEHERRLLNIIYEKNILRTK